MSAFLTIVLFTSQVILLSLALECLAQLQDLLQYKEQSSLVTDNSSSKYDETPTPGIIQRYGYPAEVHSVTTDDGYILELHRIPHGKNRIADPLKKPVLVQHGFLASSSDWVLTGPNLGLAFLLADKGYDVWLGNCRGNIYSRKHVKYSPEELKFWDFSFHEMGLYDLPAMIDFILKKTNQDKLAYIGHSMGTTMFYVMASERPEYNEKILVQISLAPVVYLGHNIPLRLGAPFFPVIYEAVNALHHGEILSRSPLLNKAMELFCTLNTEQMIFCRSLMFLFFGADPEQFKYEIIPHVVGHSPAGASIKTFYHSAQFINSPNTFRQFDYGPVQNIQHYNSTVPPDYKISAITAKVAMFYSQSDHLADPTDVKLVYSQLSNPIGLYQVSHLSFNHQDFLWAKDVKPLIYNQVFEILDSLNGNFNVLG